MKLPIKKIRCKVNLVIPSRLAPGFFFVFFAFFIFFETPKLFANNKLDVFACEPEWKSLAEALGGAHVRVFSATTAFQDPHYVEARPSIISKARRADLLVCTGAELEIAWLDILLRQSANPKIQKGRPGFFLAASQVDLIEKPKSLDRAHGDIHAEGNPHVHWDPYRLAIIAQALGNRLQVMDPKNAPDYKAQTQKFISSWRRAIARWESQAKDLENKKIIVYHKDWSYLLNWLKIQAVASIEPKPGIPPTSAHLARLLEIARAQKVDYILLRKHQNDRGAKWLHRKTGIPILYLPYTVSASPKAIDIEALYDEVLSILAQKSKNI